MKKKPITALLTAGLLAAGTLAGCAAQAEETAAPSGESAAQAEETATQEADGKASADGSESGGALSRDYCRHCRQDGAFTWDCGMEEMIDFCLRSAPELYQDRERSRALMRGYFPTLRRWQPAGR